jgi:hypothetical protein
MRRSGEWQLNVGCERGDEDAPAVARLRRANLERRRADHVNDQRTRARRVRQPRKHVRANNFGAASFGVRHKGMMMMMMMMMMMISDEHATGRE